MIKKRYEDLEFIDDFMFCKILTTRLDLCKELIELILDIDIKDIKQCENQKPIELKYDSRGIRLDVYVNDENGTVYDLEMQTSKKKDLPKRTRYYQGMIDLNLIERGAYFYELKKSYVVFICKNDPFGKGLPIYTFENICEQDYTLKLGDDAIKVVINPESDRIGLSQEMNNLLDYIQGKKRDVGLVKELSDAVNDAKRHKEWEADYMTLHLKLLEEREEGREEGREETLIQVVSNMLNSGMSSEEIVTILDGVDLEFVANVQKLA